MSMYDYLILTEDMVESVFPAFSFERKSVRKQWDNALKTNYVSWDKFLHDKAIEKICTH